ncbi:MAG: hypothetical protein L3K15_09190 [Thermoplasmata archaeon]|nr:hypothetical protein [Thermoplasmata archaeon]
MPVEMVSGPDMGGGFLFQLTRDTAVEPARFIFHAQDGGADAGGPPPGSPEPFGYYHPSTPCAFGGPRCWHREFELSASETARVRAAYNRTRFVMEAMLAQSYAAAEVPVEDGLRELLQRVPAPASPREAMWWVGGSAAFWLRGFSARPHDLDLGVTPRGAVALGDALAEYLIEPSGPVLDAPGARHFGGRAFLGTHRRGTRVEWAVAGAGSSPKFAESVAGELDGVEWEGRAIPLTPIEFGLIRIANRLDATTWPNLLDWLRTQPLRHDRLAMLLDRESIPASRADDLRTLLASLHR